MRKVFSLLVLCLLCVFSQAAAQSKEERKVAAAVEELKQAMLSGDRAALEAIVAPGLSYGHSSGKVENKATFVETLASGASDFVTLDLTGQTIEVSGKTALVRHQLAGQTNDGGKPGTVKLGILLVWQKQSGDWKLLARQAFRL